MNAQDKKILYIVGIVIVIFVFIHNPFSGYWDVTNNPLFNGSRLTECADQEGIYCNAYHLPFWSWQSKGALVYWFAKIQNLLLSIVMIVVVAGAVRGILNIKEEKKDE